MYNNQAVAAKIKTARLFRNYSQDYLAYKLNISQNAYSKIELGQTKITLERIIAIAEILEVRMNKLMETSDIQDDIDAITKMDMVPKMLDVICQTTHMRFTAIARVTETKWVACSVRDEIDFGLKAGGELELETTICNHIRQSRKAVVIDHVDTDEIYAGHPTALMYGFQSYISVPIIHKDGTLFGTLCAIDPKPLKVNNAETIGLFELFADLIAFHLDSRFN